MHLNISKKILGLHVVEIHFEDLDYPLQLPRPIKLISTRFNKKKHPFNIQLNDLLTNQFGQYNVEFDFLIERFSIKKKNERTFEINKTNVLLHFLVLYFSDQHDPINSSILLSHLLVDYSVIDEQQPKLIY